MNYFFETFLVNEVNFEKILVMTCFNINMGMNKSNP